MNAVEIEEAVSDLAAAPFDALRPCSSARPLSVILPTPSGNSFDQQ
jgi:hypothetical protein